jgi:nucleoside-diphosphate-sugar epimerase
MKRVLVTGAAGFIGRFTLAPLATRGFEVHAADLRRPEGISADAAFVYHQADLLAPGAPLELIKTVVPTHLLHLAWYSTPGLYWNASENLGFLAASVELLRGFHQVEGRRAVIIGSCAEYDWEHGYCTEGVTPLAPSTLYGAAKDALRRVTDRYASGNGLSWAWARPFFLYGPHEHPKRLVASLITALLARQPAPMSHGRQIRDLMHVADVGAALAALLDSTVQGPVNIASGGPISLAAVANQIVELTGGADLLRPGAISAPASDPPLVVGNPRRLNEEVGFKPRFDLEAGLADTVEWWRAQKREVR